MLKFSSDYFNATSLWVICCMHIHFAFSRYLDQIERAVSNGDCVLIENIGESLDPVLDPIIGRNTIKKGRSIFTFLFNCIQLLRIKGKNLRNKNVLYCNFGHGLTF